MKRLLSFLPLLLFAALVVVRPEGLQQSLNEETPYPIEPQLVKEGYGPFDMNLSVGSDLTREHAIAVQVSSVGEATTGLHLTVSGSAVRRRTILVTSAHTVLKGQLTMAPSLVSRGADTIEVDLPVTIPRAPDRATAGLAPGSWDAWRATLMSVQVSVLANIAGSGELELTVSALNHPERKVSHRVPVVVTP